MRKAGHLDFDRNGNELFHFFGGSARPLRDDRHVIVGDIRVGLDGQRVKGESAPNRQKNPGRHDNKFVV